MDWIIVTVLIVAFGGLFIGEILQEVSLANDKEREDSRVAIQRGLEADISSWQGEQELRELAKAGEFAYLKNKPNVYLENKPRWIAMYGEPLSKEVFDIAEEDKRRRDEQEAYDRERGIGWNYFGVMSEWNDEEAKGQPVFDGLDEMLQTAKNRSGGDKSLNNQGIRRGGAWICSWCGTMNKEEELRCGGCEHTKVTGTLYG